MSVMRRVVILGRGGAGKSTFARSLSEITGIPAVQLDEHFWSATLEPLIDPAFHRGLWAKPEERATVATADDHSKLARAAAPVAAVIEKQGFLAGPGLTAADIVLGGVLQWADSVDLLRDLATLKGYLTKLRERPAFARAVAD